MGALSLLARVLALGSLMGSAVPAPERSQTPQFSAAEVVAVQSFWSGAGRYSRADQFAEPYQVRQTAASSMWLHGYYKARGEAGKIIPGQDPAAGNPRHAEWDAIIDRHYAVQEYLASVAAWRKNVAETGRSLPEPGMIDTSVPAMPQDLIDLAGAAPQFVEVVRPVAHMLNFGDLKLKLNDRPKVRRKYAYLRFADGVMDGGTPMKGDLSAFKPLFAKARISESVLKVMAAVSLLEGGFDSINTYDTGFVSVGFIQFASLKGGSGSLGQVMLAMKRENPSSFDQNFRRFGLDVSSSGELVALDLGSGVEKVGPEANTAIITDPRLAGVFVRAGRMSEAFRLAQIRVAVDQYYPGDDEVTLQIEGVAQRAKIKDIVLTEAGMATLMDRKVNTGKLGDFVAICERLAYLYGFTSAKDLAKVEYQLVRQMKYRKDYMAPDYVLSKPRDLGLAMARGGGFR